MRKWTETADYGTKVHNEIEQWFKKDREPKDIKAKNGRDWLERYRVRADMDIYSEVIVYSTDYP